MEHIIGRQDLEAFVCEDQEDASNLMNIFRRELNYKQTNIICSDPKVDQNLEFRNPSSNNFDIQPDTFLNQVVRDCPEAIMKHLCKSKKLHQFPVFSREPEYANVKTYFVNQKKFQNQKSKYSNNNTTYVEDLNHEKPQILTGEIADNDIIIQVEKRIEEYKVVQNQHQTNLDFFDGQLQEQATIQVQKNDRLNELNKEKTKIAKIKGDLQSLQNRYNNLKSGVSIQEMIQKSRAEIIEFTRQLLPANRELLMISKESVDNHFKLEMNSLFLKQHEDYKNKAMEPYQKALAEYETQLNILKDKEKRRDDVKKQLETILKEIKGPNGWKSPDPKNILTMPKELRQVCTLNVNIQMFFTLTDWNLT